MDEGSHNPKARMRAHRRQKNAYVNPKYKKTQALQAPRPSKLDSNWHHYESDPEMEDSSSSRSDFAKLSTLPITSGTHFIMKDTPAVESLPSETSESFQLDLKLLWLSLSTIHFTKRNGIINHLGSVETPKEAYATQIRKQEYQQYLMNNGRVELILKNDDGNSSSSGSDNELSEEDVCVETPRKLPTEREASTANDSASSSGESKLPDDVAEEATIKLATENETFANVKQKDDLEKWLDDLLED